MFADNAKVEKKTNMDFFRRQTNKYFKQKSSHTQNTEVVQTIEQMNNARDHSREDEEPDVCFMKSYNESFDDLSPRAKRAREQQHKRE